MRWDWSGDGKWDTAPDTSKIRHRQFDRTGEHRIVVRVEDSKGQTDSSARTLMVDPVSLAGDLVPVPEGPCCLGNPPAIVNLAGFEIGKSEVTNREYCQALNWALVKQYIVIGFGADSTSVNLQSLEHEILLEMGEAACRIAYKNHQRQFVVTPGFDEHPVVCVTWFGAIAFCNWCSEYEGSEPLYIYNVGTKNWTCNLQASGYRLPTGDEWTKAARGHQDSREYPWGTGVDCSKCNYLDCSHETTVGVYHPAYHDGCSPYGCWHMSGNAWELCDDDATDTKPVRGGSWGSAAEYVRCTSVGRVYPSAPQSPGGIGFRVVRKAVG